MWVYVGVCMRIHVCVMHMCMHVCGAWGLSLLCAACVCGAMLVVDGAPLAVLCLLFIPQGQRFPLVSHVRVCGLTACR